MPNGIAVCESRRYFLTDRLQKFIYGEGDEANKGSPSEPAATTSLGLGDRVNMFLEKQKANVKASNDEKQKEDMDRILKDFYAWLANLPSGLSLDAYLQYYIKLLEDMTGKGTWRERIPGDERKQMLKVVEQMEMLRTTLRDNSINDAFRISQDDIDTIVGVTSMPREEVLNTLKQYVQIERTQRWLRRRQTEALTIPKKEAELIAMMAVDKRGLPKRTPPPMFVQTVTKSRWREAEKARADRRMRMNKARERLGIW